MRYAICAIPMKFVFCKACCASELRVVANAISLQGWALFEQWLRASSLPRPEISFHKGFSKLDEVCCQGNLHTCVIQTDGVLRCFGDNRDLS